jgi:hypothetical protein
MIERGFTILIFIISINAVLVASGYIQDRTLFSWVPGEIQTEYYDSSNYVAPTSQSTSGVTAQGQDSPVAFIWQLLQSLWGIVPGVIQQVTGGLFSLLGQWLFGYIIAMQTAGIPGPIIFIIGVPLAFIELATIGYLLATIIAGKI